MIKGKRKILTKSGLKEKIAKLEDFFSNHYAVEFEDAVAKRLMQSPLCSLPSSSLSLEGIGVVQYEERSTDTAHNLKEERSFEEFGISSKLVQNFEFANGGEASVFQKMLFNVIGKYIDLYSACRVSENMVLYCLHALNHIIKTRNLVISNNQRLQKLRDENSLTEVEIEKARDQGFGRPKVLILCPMRKDAFAVVDCICKLIFADSSKPFVTNFQRFKTEFGDNGYRVSEKKVVSDEYRDLMSGNNDDCFRLGVGIAKKGLRLYASFEKSDIIIASPLGLRMIIGDETEVDREVGFLSSIEVLIADKADVMLMQNWEHFLHVIDSLHCNPEKIVVDISRMRYWALNQQAKLYRQTMIFSSVRLTECFAVFAMKCFNFAGFISFTPPSTGLLANIEVPVCQELLRFEVENAENQSDERFAFFKKKILSKCDSGTLIFVPSYFDYVKLRNYLKRENESFVQLNEYAKAGKVAKARVLFFNGRKKLMLLTERFHFFRRYHIKGIKFLVFYQPPALPSFYHEFVNMVSSQDRVLVRLLYSKFDADRMKNIFGDLNYAKMAKSGKNVHVLLSH